MLGNPVNPDIELKPNSDKSRAMERKDIKPVVSNKVINKKTSIGKKFVDTFFSEDIHNVKTYIIRDVLIPGLRDGIYDIFSGSLSMMFYGDSGRRRPSGSGSKSAYVNYSNMSTNKKREVKKNGLYSYNEIIFSSRDDVTEVKYSLVDILERYKMVTVADFYELAGEESSFTDQKYGWYDLEDLQIMRDRDGWKLRLPKAVPLD